MRFQKLRSVFIKTFKNCGLAVYFGPDYFFPDKIFYFAFPFYLLSKFKACVVASVNRQKITHWKALFIAEDNVNFPFCKLAKQISGKRNGGGFYHKN